MDRGSNVFFDLPKVVGGLEEVPQITHEEPQPFDRRLGDDRARLRVGTRRPAAFSDWWAPCWFLSSGFDHVVGAQKRAG
jgi:hypothetical protein